MEWGYFRCEAYEGMQMTMMLLPLCICDAGL
jgi:hypothetical protein